MIALGFRKAKARRGRAGRNLGSANSLRDYSAVGFVKDFSFFSVLQKYRGD